MEVSTWIGFLLFWSLGLTSGSAFISRPWWIWGTIWDACTRQVSYALYSPESSLFVGRDGDLSDGARRLGGPLPVILSLGLMVTVYSDKCYCLALVVWRRSGHQDCKWQYWGPTGLYPAVLGKISVLWLHMHVAHQTLELSLWPLIVFNFLLKLTL